MGRILYPPTYDSSMDPYGQLPEYPPELYITDIPLVHIETYLSAVKACVKKDDFYVEEGDGNKSRLKNRAFIFTYGLHVSASLKRLLLGLDPHEFCHIKKTEYGGHLYVFCAQRELYKALSGMETVLIYIKFDYDKKRRKKLVVVSLHELEEPICVPFQE